MSAISFKIDMHTHSTFSHDGKDELKTMLAAAQEKGISFYGVSEHFDFDYNLRLLSKGEQEALRNVDYEDYFHTARHLQEDYEGVMNVAVGAEFGYSDEKSVHAQYRETYEKYRPDFVINSVHSGDGLDFALRKNDADKQTLYSAYLGLIRRSLEASYPYDIVGHIGYIARYVSYENTEISLSEFGEQIDDILLTIIQKGKILEANTATKQLPQITLPSEAILRRYYELGGRKVSYGSDAHFTSRIGEKWEETVALLKEIGFTYLTVPFKGEHIEVKI